MAILYFILILLLAYIFYLKLPLKLAMNLIKYPLNRDYQVVVVVNHDLHMSKGKVLSQFGHAIDALHDILLGHQTLAKVWRASGSAKIALKGRGEDLEKAYHDAKTLGIPYARIYDAGRTQVKSGSNTVIAIGPATKKELQPITGHLQLY